MNNSYFFNKNILITGGTDGIGAATATELTKLGANVHIFGRNLSKAENLIKNTKLFKGKLTYTIADFSLMNTVRKLASDIAEKYQKIDIIIHAVGILVTKPQHTQEGLEIDFAVSYLSRFVFNETLFSLNVFSENTIIINIAASSPKIPKYAQMEFNDYEEVQKRVGIKSHGQAQLANDLYTAIASKRYNIISIAYGPGSVNTNIRREIPLIFRIIIKPFFTFSTRKPIDVANQIISILLLKNLNSKNYYYFNKNGEFQISDFIKSSKRQNELLTTTIKIVNSIFH